MFVVRETFTARPGMASKLAALLKQSIPSEPGAKIRVLTDHVGAFNSVVMETEVADLNEFDRRMKEYSERPDVRERMRGYTDMYLTGAREIYRVI